MNFSRLSLKDIRNELVRLEDSIIFSLIERTQFAYNEKIYRDSGDLGIDGSSFLEYLLHEIECVHAKVRRYTSPDETPFTHNLPQPVLPPLRYPKLLIPNAINVNIDILTQYKHFIKRITKEGDDLNYGSSATRDVESLFLLSRRIHFGKFVAEAKYSVKETRTLYDELIKRGDERAIEELLTDRKVEKELLDRLREKAVVYSRYSNGVDVDAVVDFYKDFVIPLTKKVEVEYLLERGNYPDFEPEM